jgi:hypothetical protein
VLIIPSQPSSPDLTGYLDADEPHAINYLIVQKLGKDEVVATVRDDGDVEAILIRHVVHAITTRINNSDAGEPLADNVRPLFQRNVGISAWGLAIHTQARMIAVSSNRHEVTVFRFGLVDHQLDPSEQSPRRTKTPLNGQSTSKHDRESTDDDVDSRPDRDADVTRQVLNGEANIPHVSFCNTGDDPDGRWLLTTDISGVCRAIDLHKFALVQAFRFGPSIGTVQGGGYDRLNAGWGIIFLDKRSFIAQETIQDALGMDETDVLPDAKSDMRIWDISKTTRLMPDVSHAFSEPIKKRPTATSISNSTTETSSGTSSPSGDRNISRLISTTLATALGQTNSDEDEDEDDDASGVPIDLDALSPRTNPDPQPDEEESLEHDIEMWSDLDESEGENTEDSIPAAAYYSGERICGNVPGFVRSTNLCEDLPCPILHASIRNIYLLQPSQQRHGPDQPFLPPMVGLAAPLRQSIQAEYRMLNMFDRLSMHAYIPTLGVVILASQKGRAIVLSLTRVLQSMKYPVEIDPKLGVKTNYAMRTECILPFKSQEKAGQRPFSPLHGIAVGPIQGTENVRNAAKKRWRLIMMFQDHSLLTYEIRRTTSADVGVEELVV